MKGLIILYCLWLTFVLVEGQAQNTTLFLNDTSTDPTNSTITCHLSANDSDIHDSIAELTQRNVNLIHYKFIIRTLETPSYLTTEGWARVSNLHGQTLLSMEFTHGVMSLMTLTLGEEYLTVELADDPPGCLQDLPEQERFAEILDLLGKDFGNETSVMLPEKICRHVIVEEGGSVARFKNKCCGRTGREYTCDVELGNMWLTLLGVLLNLVRYGTLLFGPALFVRAVVKLGAGIEDLPYKVPCPEGRPLKRTIRVYKDKLPEKLPRHQHVLDIRKKHGFPKLYRSLHKWNIPLGQTIPVSIQQYDILVTHDKCVTEDHVPVGFWPNLARIIFRCKLNRMGPFRACLQAPMCCGWMWIDLMKKIGAVLMVLTLPLPYYIRVFVFYQFEKSEVENRKLTAEDAGLTLGYEHSLVQYLSPLHPVFIIIYSIYAITSLTITYLMTRKDAGEQCIKKILFDSFFDYRYFYWIHLWRLFVSNLVFPLKRFGAKGCLLGLIYWPIVMPITLIVCLFYYFPTTYVFYRMIYHSIFGGLRVVSLGNQPHRYKVERHQDTSFKVFYADHWWPCCKHSHDSLDGEDHLRTTLILHGDEKPLSRGGKLSKYLFAVILCILNMIGVLLLLSECIGFFVEVVMFTMMGIIVNAGFLLVYVSFAFLIVVYCYDCFNNVTVAYYKLNKAIFWTLLSKLESQIYEVSGETATQQENTGFIIEDALTRAERALTTRQVSWVPDPESDSEDEDWDWLYQGRDDLDPENGLRPEAGGSKPPGHPSNKKSYWNINDLVLFMDNRDIPRIPRRLFEEVCNIRLHGLPGPLYLSHLNAFKQLTVICIFLFFVFIVIQTFGMVYSLTTGNKLIATLVSGFIPMILRNFLAPAPPDIDVRNVNFKTRMNQILVNFNQWWPVYDFPFTMCDVEAEAGPGDASVSAVPGIAPVSAVAQNMERANQEEDRASSRTSSDAGRDHAARKPQSPRVNFDEPLDGGSVSMMNIGADDAQNIDYILLISSMDYWETKPPIDRSSTCETAI